MFKILQFIYKKINTFLRVYAYIKIITTSSWICYIRIILQNENGKKVVNKSE